MAALSHLHVMVTRPVHQAESLGQEIEKKGGEVTYFPTLEIVSICSFSEIENKLKQAKQIDFFVLVSANAVFPAAKHLHKYSAPILSVGPGTELALNKEGLKVKSRPQKEYSVEGLLKLPELQSIKEKNIVIFSGKQSNPNLKKVLTERGGRVYQLEVYERVCPSVDITPYLFDWKKNVQVIVSTSRESLKNLYQMISPVDLVWLQSLPILIISKSMAETARELKLGNPLIMSSDATHHAILNALIKWKNHGKRN